jgi:hypothetical protein
MNATERRTAARERTAAEARQQLADAVTLQGRTGDAAEWLAAKALIESALTTLARLDLDRRAELQLAIDTARAAIFKSWKMPGDEEGKALDWSGPWPADYFGKDGQ